MVAPGADPRMIRLQVAGADSMELDAAGNLVLHTAGGDVVEHAPVIYQESGGVRQNVSGEFVLEGNGQVGFAVGAYDSSLPLTIDPTLSYGSYFGTSGSEQGNGIGVDAAGNAYVVGTTPSSTIPITAGSFQPTYGGGNYDIFVTKFNATGTAVLYSTYIGGQYDDYGSAITVDAAGDAYITGSSDSFSFPTTAGAYQPKQPGAYSNYVIKINPTGTALLYSTFIGNNDGWAIAVDGAGNAYIAGRSYYSNYPTTPGSF